MNVCLVREQQKTKAKEKMSFLRASEKRKELDEKRKPQEETRHDEPQEKEVVSAGVGLSGMTAKLKLIYKELTPYIEWCIQKTNKKGKHKSIAFQFKFFIHIVIQIVQ